METNYSVTVKLNWSVTDFETATAAIDGGAQSISGVSNAGGHLQALQQSSQRVFE